MVVLVDFCERDCKFKVYLVFIFRKKGILEGKKGTGNFFDLKSSESPFYKALFVMSPFSMM